MTEQPLDTETGKTLAEYITAALKTSPHRVKAALTRFRKGDIAGALEYMKSNIKPANGLDFYARNPHEVAKDLLGDVIVRELPNSEGTIMALVTEVQAFEKPGKDAQKEYFEMDPGLYYDYVVNIYGPKHFFTISTHAPGKSGVVTVSNVIICGEEYEKSGIPLILKLDETMDKKPVNSADMYITHMPFIGLPKGRGIRTDAPKGTEKFDAKYVLTE